MKTWRITLNEPWFEYVKLGIKKYEGRCNWKDAAKYTIGDILHISHHTEPLKQSFDVEIVDIIHYNTFETALINMGMDEILPNVETIEEGINIYLSYVKLSTQLANGIIMFKIKNKI